MNPIRVHLRLNSLSHSDVLIARRFDVRVPPAGYERLEMFDLGIALHEWFDEEKSRRVLLDLLGLRGLDWRPQRLDVADAMRARDLFERALDRGDIVAYGMRRRRVVMQIKGGTPSVGPADEPSPTDELIEVMVFDWTGQGLSSSLYPATVRFTTRLADGQNLPGGVPSHEWKAISGGSGVVKGISGNPPSACMLSFFDDVSDAVPTELPSPLDPSSPDPATLGRAVRPVTAPALVTRRGLVASPQPATLEMTNVFQLRRRAGEVVEFEHFAEGSAVFLPGDAPHGVYRDGDARRPAGIEVLAACLAFAQDFAPDRIVVTGHDGSVSQQRADCVRALLVGDAASRATWQAIALATAAPDDPRRILAWAALTFTWDCDPGIRAMSAAVQAFKIAFNEDVGRGLFPVATPRLSLEDGVLDAAAWGAIFDCYMRAIRPVATPGSAGEPAYIIVDDKHQTYPVELAEIAAPGRDANRWTDLDPLNPQMVIPNGGGWHGPQVGQKIFIPDDWDLDALGPGGAGYEIHRRTPPVPPARPGPPPVAPPGPRAFGCGAHHLRTPFADDENRRARERHVDVVFFDPGEAPSVVACGPGAGPCASALCELYDPREFSLEYLRCVDGVIALDDLLVRFPFDAAHARQLPDVLVLETESGAAVRKPVADAARAGDDGRAEVYFPAVSAVHRYRLRVENVDEPYTAFELTPFVELSSLGAAPSAPGLIADPSDAPGSGKESAA